MSRNALDEAFQHYLSLHNESRYVVLVGYKVKYVLRTLKNLNIEIPPTIKIIDTSILGSAENFKNKHMDQVIKKVLKELELPDVHPRYLSKAGNVANFNMRMLLMLAIRELEKMEDCTEFQKDRISALKSIASAPIQEKLTIFTPDRLAIIRELEIRAAKRQVKMQEQIAQKGIKRTKQDDWLQNLDGGIDIGLGEAEESSGVL